jgi:hypothetical protein
VATAIQAEGIGGAGFEVLTAGTVDSTVSWLVIPCNSRKNQTPSSGSKKETSKL